MENFPFTKNNKNGIIGKMYSGEIIEVFVSSPVDVVAERKIVYKLIEEWNIINTRNRKQILRSITWEKDVYSAFGVSAQEIINKQILDDADILIAIFNARLGTPTKDYSSGSVEEIIKHIKKNKPAMIYFSNANIDRKTLDIEQLNKLDEFKNWCKDKSVYFEYSDMNNFENIVRTQIGLLLNDNTYFNSLTKKLVTEQNHGLTQKQNDIIQLLSQISEDRNLEKLKAYINEIGNYRFKKIAPILKSLNILDVAFMSSGQNIFTRHGFERYSKKDIEGIIYEIKNGELKV
jgi:hypothetical protein